MKNNEFIKKKLKSSGITQYRVAQKLDMGETTLCRLLRDEIDNDLEAKILNVIKTINKERMINN